MESQRQTCFVIAPIGNARSKARLRSDRILNEIIIPAASECGYQALRADQLADPGLITSLVIQHLVTDPLVIADLTGQNPNVFYELALRHATRKPIVQIIRAGESIPFDVAGIRTIQIDHTDDDHILLGKTQLADHIRIVRSENLKTSNPVSVALGPWFFGVSPLQIPREAIEDLLLIFAELFLVAEYRGEPDTCRKAEVRLIVDSMERPLDFLSDKLGLPPAKSNMDYYRLIRHMVSGRKD